MARIETREVLAAAYPTGNLKSLLKHAVEVDSDGNEIRVLCNRVKLENLADRNAGNPNAEPTCKTCRHRMGLGPAAS